MVLDNTNVEAKQCVYCNWYLQQNLQVQCSLNFKFCTYSVTK